MSHKPLPAAPRTCFAQARALIIAWHPVDLRQASLPDLRTAEATLLRLFATAPADVRLPGTALLERLTAELRRRAARQVSAAAFNAGPYTAALASVCAVPLTRHTYR